MDLELRIPGSKPLRVVEAILERGLGLPVTWSVLTELQRQGKEVEVIAGLASAIEGSAVKSQVVLRGKGESVLGPEGFLTAGEWEVAKRADGTAAELLRLTAHVTTVTGDPFTPRRRVHHVRNLLRLLDIFKDVARLDAGVRNQLERIEFPDGDNVSIVQDGPSDWDFVDLALRQYGFLQTDTALRDLSLMGSVDEQTGTSTFWKAAWGSKRAYEKLGDVGRRLKTFGAADGLEHVHFGGGSVERIPTFPHGRAPAAVRIRERRDFDAGRWREWRTLDPPIFVEPKNAMVWRIQDRLYQTGVPDELGWDTWLHTLPSEPAVAGPVARAALQPWVGIGTVHESSPTEPWTKIKLPGFEPGEDIVTARLTTPFSGKNGTRGLHLVPEKGTEVFVAWSGRFKQSVLLAGNTRTDAAEFEAPSVWLEDPATAQFADVTVKEIGDTVVESTFDFAVKRDARIQSTNVMKVKADGADLKLEGGTVYTGRGF